LPTTTKGHDVELVLLLFTLLCPLSMLGLMGWWAWSMRRTASGNGGPQAQVRSVKDENEITRLRAQLDQLEARIRDETSRASG
jgi:uncharacterized iron-regulated membrane protein